MTTEEKGEEEEEDYDEEEVKEEREEDENDGEHHSCSIRCWSECFGGYDDAPVMTAFSMNGGTSWPGGEANVFEQAGRAFV